MISMATLVEKINLIKSDPVNNNNKFWTGELYDDDTVVCKWGRVGDDGQEKTFAGAGKDFLYKKVNEKKRAGRNGEIAYRAVDIFGDSPVKSTSAAPVKTSGFKQLAKKQIKYNDSETPKLIEYLTEQNVHDICSFTDNNIKYNYETGAFVTPLGPISQNAINEARDILSEIADLVVVKNYGETLMDRTRDLLMIVPQNIGRKRLELSDFWNDGKVQDQNTLLDGLEASLQSATVVNPSSSAVVEEKVFDTTLDLVTDMKLQNMIFDYYNKTKSTMHSCHNFKPIKLWKCNINSMDEAFNKDGAKMENIVPGFHGSGTANVLSLLKSGMLIRPPKNVHVAGDLFGHGIYCAPLQRVGAKNLTVGAGTKALNYATNFWGGKRASRTFMFVVQMAMGKYYIPKASTYQSISYPVKGHDSTWAYGGDSGVRNDEAIVYRSSQVNIKYLVEFKE